jgi:hypothetical protein
MLSALWAYWIIHRPISKEASIIISALYAYWINPMPISKGAFLCFLPCMPTELVLGLYKRCFYHVFFLRLI